MCRQQNIYHLYKLIWQINMNIVLINDKLEVSHREN